MTSSHNNALHRTISQIRIMGKNHNSMEDSL